jgi:SnoaL-like domain
MSDIENVVSAYLTAWNARDDQARAAAAERAFAPTATYVDPVVAADGRDSLVAVIAGVQQQFPGLTFTPGEVLDAHHDVVRFTWHLGTPEQPDLIVGFDVATLGEDGRIERVVGFLDKVPAA